MSGIEPATVSIDTIIRMVAGVTGVTVLELQSPRRARRVARPRQIAMYLARRLTGHSYPCIGMLFGNRDHTTVMHAVKKIDALQKTDAGVATLVLDLRHAIVAGRDERMRVVWTHRGTGERGWMPNGIGRGIAEQLRSVLARECTDAEFSVLPEAQIESWRAAP